MALIWGTDAFDVERYFSFKLPYFQENLLMMLGMGAICGALRLTRAIGLLAGSALVLLLMGYFGDKRIA